VELSPSYGTAHQWYGNWLCSVGRVEAGLAELSLAAELDPVSPAVSESVALGLWHSGRAAEAERQLHETLELDPGFARARLSLGVLLALRGDLAAAARELVGVWETGAWGATPREAAQAANLLAQDPHATLAYLLERVHLRAKSPGFERLLEVVLLMLLDRLDEAVAALEAGRGRRWLGFVVLFAPVFDALADRPQFRHLMEEIGDLLPRWRAVPSS
jgi:tetratricopeptide (TPR) repeat protein